MNPPTDAEVMALLRERAEAARQRLPELPPKVPQRCGAKCKRTGLPCRAWGIWPSMRCRMHSGRARQGLGNARLKHGRYSRCPLARLVMERERVEQFEREWGLAGLTATEKLARIVDIARGLAEGAQGNGKGAP